jgi:DNA-binding NtrC family response regulator
MRFTIRCPHCKLNQFARESCRRCNKQLSQSRPVTVFSAVDVLPTLAEMERHLFTEAVYRADGNKVLASQALGVGKTTLYRKLNGWQG